MTWTRLSTEDACGHVVRLVPRACVCKRLKGVEFYFDGLEPGFWNFIYFPRAKNVIKILERLSHLSTFKRYFPLFYPRNIDSLWSQTEPGAGTLPRVASDES